MDNISNEKFGRLLNNTSRICLNWEAYMWCLLPIFYKTNNINNKLIKLMTNGILGIFRLNQETLIIYVIQMNLLELQMKFLRILIMIITKILTSV